ncbi:DUF1345 domain-containing protein [Microbacterium sp. 4R-513]|uniref:DUF1345 domain-containing protein n=1 Tax=Microbacterium sp. 4R-513 TaxID=2567934 RepID=UPI0013E11569|nr:DUF1345 domain-containing protein [Microbacterium sp. 4R-513]QIG39900.1 DUF1345 domain-containing protein [Microbacterium sp. 4R-513]
MVVGVIARSVDLLVQLALIVLGATLVFTEDDGTTIEVLALWCLIGTLYWIAAVIAVGVSVRRGPERTTPWLQQVDRHPVVGLVSTIATFAASLVGIVAATEILLLRNDPDWAVWVEPVAVWAMLLSWALFHWGYARIYDRRYRRAPSPPPLVFPGAVAPRLVDFVYFSFTNATTFSVSDVVVQTSRMRWTVVWHTTFSFFLNALIIVLAFSTILDA